MKLRRIANTMTRMVNPNTTITWRRGKGVTQDDQFNRITTYEDVTIRGQIQPLTTNDLQFVDGLNVTGYHRCIYLDGQSTGVVRGNLKPLDEFIINGETWRVIATPEAWDASGWSRVFVTLQQTTGSGSDQSGN